MRSQKEDLAFGLASEAHHLALLSDFLEPLRKTPSTFAPFDYSNESNTLYVELKTRRIPHRKYPTTLIGKNKVDFASKDPSRRFYFVFCYTDGLYYIRYDKELFDSFEVDDFCRSPRTGCWDRPAPYVFIPIEKLTPLQQPLQTATS